MVTPHDFIQQHDAIELGSVIYRGNMKAVDPLSVIVNVTIIQPRVTLMKLDS